MHYYQHHIGDFIKDTSFLTNEEIGIYLKLLWIYYDTEKPLPDSIFELSMKVNARDQDVVISGLLEMFFTKGEGCWHHSRCDREIFSYQQQIEIASKAGKASAAKRALNKRSTGVKQSLNERITDVQPTNNHEPRTKNHIDTPEGVDNLVWKDFIEIRKRRKAPITERVIEGLAKEAKIANMSLNDVIKECVVRGWQSFKAEWVVKQNPADIVRVTVPGNQERDPALLKLDKDRSETKPPTLEMLARLAALRNAKA